jgi:dienelactone hydrolase
MMHAQENRRRWFGFRRAVVLVTLGLLPILAGAVLAESPRVLPPGQTPADIRLGPLKDLDGYFPFPVPDSRAAWHERAEALRRQLLVSQGLWPMPTKTPLNAVIHGRLEQDGYSVEKVYFESLPGFFVTGNLYRPLGKSGKHPGVLSPHGHWANGRFTDSGHEAVLREIVQGAERFEQGGRSPLQARCVQLARMGCVVFHWDMIGYADSRQIPFEIIHGFNKQRPEMNDPQSWGLFSPQAESHLQSAMGLQTWNSIRALDFLTGLPDVDTERIGLTGASGGGTQTFMLAALDPRIRVSFPAVMVSTAMQGGCTCENACWLRVGTGNIEIAALFAPQPLGLTDANDWTKEMATKGYPELRQLYTLFDAADRVMLKSLTHFDHNYNYVSRAAMYSWFNRHLNLGCAEPVVETDYRRLSTAEMTVWNDEHPEPPGGAELERQVLAWWTQDAARQLDALAPLDAPAPGENATPDRYQAVVAAGVETILGGPLPDPETIRFHEVARVDHADHREIRGLLTRELTPRDKIGYRPDQDLSEAQEQLPLIVLRPANDRGRACVMLSAEGKSGLFEPDGTPVEAVRRLLHAGLSVCGVDLLYQGEFLADGRPLEATRRVPNPREAAAYTFGYNPTLFACRVRDVLTVLQWLRHEEYAAEGLDLVAFSGAGHWAVAARACAGPTVTRLAVDTGGFRFAQVRSIDDPDFLPGGAKYHDLPGMLAAAAPAPVWIAGEQDSELPLVERAYAAGEHGRHLHLHSAEEGPAMDGALDWLLER